MVINPNILLYDYRHHFPVTVMIQKTVVSLKLISRNTNPYLGDFGNGKERHFLTKNPHEWTVRRRSSSSVKAWTGVLICFLTINFETDRDQSSFETLPLLIFINSSHNDLDETWWDNPGACKVLIVVFRIFKSHQFGVGNRSSWSSYFNQLKRSCGVFEG